MGAETEGAALSWRRCFGFCLPARAGGGPGHSKIQRSSRRLRLHKPPPSGGAEDGGGAGRAAFCCCRGDRRSPSSFLLLCPCCSCFLAVLAPDQGRRRALGFELHQLVQPASGITTRRAETGRAPFARSGSGHARLQPGGTRARPRKGRRYEPVERVKTFSENRTLYSLNNIITCLTEKLYREIYYAFWLASIRWT